MFTKNDAVAGGGTMQRKALSAVAAALAFGVAGCGGSDPPTPLTKAAFIQQANKACSTAEARTFKERGELLARFILLEQRKASGIRALTPPTTLQARYADYTRVLTARVSLFERYRAAYRAKEVTKALTEETSRMQAQEATAAGALGLAICKSHA